jgi:hypothetical protein
MVATRGARLVLGLPFSAAVGHRSCGGRRQTLFAADAAGLMLIDAHGVLCRASATDPTAQTIEAGQERLAQGPCWAAFSQPAPQRAA